MVYYNKRSLQGIEEYRRMKKIRKTIVFNSELTFSLDASTKSLNKITRPK